MSSQNRVPSSLYCDLFYNNPGAAEFRTAHLSVWVQTALFGASTEEISILRTRFCEAYLGVEVSDEDIEAVVGSLADADLVVRDGAKLQLTSEGRAKVRAAKDRFERSREQFRQSVANYVRGSEIEDLQTEEIDALKACAEELITRVSLAERQALEVLYEQVSDFSYVSNQAKDRREELRACLQGKLPNTLATRLLELRAEGLNGIARATEEGRAFLVTLNRSAISSFFLIRDPHHAENIRRRVTRRTYFMDTNVYLACMYSSQPAHALVRPLLESLRNAGTALRILPETVEEIRRIEDQARSVIPRAQGDAVFAQYLVTNKKAIFTDFWRARSADKNLQFSTFAELHMDPDRTLPRLGIEVQSVQFDEGEDFEELVPTFRNAVRGAKEDRGRIVRTEAVDHDARMLVAISKLQLRGERDEWGSQVQLITLDGSLGSAIEEVRNQLNRRVEWPMHPSSMARLMLPTSGTDLPPDQYESFVAASVRENLGLLTEVSGYSSIDLIEKIDRAGIPTRSLLAAPPELLERALVQLQGRRDLTRKLDQALGQEPEARRPILVDIQKDLEEALSVGSELLKETEENLARLQTDRTKLGEEFSALQEQLGDLQTAYHRQQERILKDEQEMATLRTSLEAREKGAKIAWAATAGLFLLVMAVLYFSLT